MSRIPAPKQIPSPAVILNLLSLTANGTTGALTNQGATVFDLNDETICKFNEGLLRIEGTVTDGQGATPTLPGASKNYTIHYAFRTTPLPSALDAPTVLGGTTVKHDLAVVVPNILPTFGAATLTLSSNPLNGNTIAVGLGTDVYTFVTTLSGAAYEVVIGGTTTITATNLKDAINDNAGQEGTTFGVGTAANAHVTATSSTNTVTATSRQAGAVSGTYAVVGFTSASFTTGVPGTLTTATPPFIHEGRYLYFWWDRDAFADANSKASVTVDLIRL